MADDEAPLFRERRAVPWWWWLVAIVLVVPSAQAVVVLGPEGAAHGSAALAVGCLVVSLALIAAVLLALSRSGVRVDADGLRAGGQLLAPPAIGRVRALDARAASRVLGPDARADARLSIRPWVRAAVQVEVVRAPSGIPGSGPQPLPPYWVVSTRRPGELVTALETLRARGRGHEPANTRSSAAE